MTGLDSHLPRFCNLTQCITTSKKSIKIFLDDVREIIKSNSTAKTENLIHLLNPKIRGWANYFRFSCAKKTFRYIDHHIYKALWRWVYRRHSRKSAAWRKKKYFRRQGLRDWIFSARNPNKNSTDVYIDLFGASSVPVRRHTKIMAEATPYDPAFTEYFEKRERRSKENRLSSMKRKQSIINASK